MSRLKRFSGGLLSGYLVLGATAVSSLASVPLAFHYLSKAEFGLWTLASQVMLYVGLLDFGMSGAGMRILIDHKDDQLGTNYGSVIQTSLLVNLAHAFLVVLVGVSAAFVVGPLLDVPLKLQMQLRNLMIGQALISAVNYGTRTAPMLLMAHQRYSFSNLIQVVIALGNLGVLWIGFRSGRGVYSLLWAQGLTQVLGCLVMVGVCLQAKLLPRRGHWGRPGWRWFWELFSFGRDMFLFSIGNLLINCSQTILITRVAGLEVVTVWATCSRTFSLASQIVNRIFDYASAALAEMIVRGEKERLLRRFKSMVVFSASFGVVAGVTFAIGNQSFVRWWLGGKVGWSAWNDWLLGGWMVVLVLVRNHAGLVGLTKEFRLMRYLYFFEGLFSVSLGLVALRHGGLTAMLAVFVLGSLLISFPYCSWRTSEFFQQPWRTTALGWLRPSLRLAMALVPIGIAIGWLVQTLPPLLRFLLSSIPTGVFGLLLLVRLGLDEALHREVADRLAHNFPRLRSWFMSRHPPLPDPPAN